jgi:hypothetical protein
MIPEVFKTVCICAPESDTFLIVAIVAFTISLLCFILKIPFLENTQWTHFRWSLTLRNSVHKILWPTVKHIYLNG